jgi:hypothetical protein
MRKFMKKHYMQILVIIIFISVFLYQLFNLLRIPFIQQYSVQNIDYLRLLLYVVGVVIVLTITYNIPLLLTIEISQSLIIPSFRVEYSFNNYSYQYIPKNIIIKRFKLYSVFRC